MWTAQGYFTLGCPEATTAAWLASLLLRCLQIVGVIYPLSLWPDKVT